MMNTRMFVHFFSLFLMCFCSVAYAESKRERYNACSNEHFLSEAKKLGLPLNSRPTKAQIQRLQSSIDKLCGHLLEGKAQSGLNEMVSGEWHESDDRGRVMGTYEFANGRYVMKNLYLVVMGRGQPMVRRGTYEIVGDEIFAAARDSSGLMRTDVFVLKRNNCLMQIAEILRGKRSALPKDMQACATKKK